MRDAYDESPIGNSSNDNNLIDTELQVRLMNMVMGEASDFERDQLQLLMEQRPELAAYCKHLEHLHGLLSDVGSGEPAIDIDSATADTEWRLPADRRERVMAVLENRIVNPPPKVTLANKRSFRNWRITTMEAIVVASVACVILGLMLPATQSAREAAARLSLIEAARYRAVDLAPPPPPANRPVVNKTPNAVLSTSEPVSPNAATSDLFTHPNSFARKDTARGLGSDTGIVLSRDGTAVAGQTLPSSHYLSDDVQYFPASPENKMASEPAASGTLDSLAVQKREQASDEKQLGQSNFRRFDVDGRLAVDGEDQLDKRFVQPPTPSPNFSDIAVLNTFGDTPPSVVVGQSGGVAGAAAPAFTTDLDFAIGAPNTGKPVVPKLPDSSSSSFMAYGESKNDIGGKESKVASGTATGSNVDKFAVQEGRQAYGAPRLAERNFGGRAENGENDMGRRGSTSAGVAADQDFDGISSSVGLGFERSVENMPMSGESGNQPGSVEHWAFEKSDSKKLSDRAAAPEDRTSFLGNSQTAKSDVARSEVGTAEANQKPGEVMDAETSFSVAEFEPSNRSITIQGASIPGLRNRASTSNVIANEFSELQATDGYDLPAILGQVEVDQTGRFGQVVAKGKESDLERVNELIELQIQQMVPVLDQKESSIRARNADAIEPGYPLANRLNPNGTKETVIKEVQRIGDKQPGVPIDLTEDVKVGSRSLAIEIDRLKSARAELRSDLSSRGINRKLESAQSPELATNGRDGAYAEGKPTAPKQPVTLDEQSASAEAFSTFSLHVSDVSFKLAQAALSQSQWPEAAKIRIEEFVNALDYHDPLPSGDRKVACRVEQAIHPFVMQRNLLRVSMRTAAAGRSQNTPLRLTLLLDNSGSMERPDRRQAVLRAFQTLTQQLKATDQITLISFASSPRLLADKVPGNQGETLLKLIGELPSEGGTNIESALHLAREKATEQQVAGSQNRIVLLTDGAVNLGDASPENLAMQVTQMRDAGIAFDAAGISAQDLNDEVLEALTRQGDGRYYLLDSAEAASESFAAQIAGSLRPSAQNVKVQVEFNPQRVGRYKLLGYEKHRLNKEDFRNDQVDAAEMAAAEAGVAVYQYEIKPKGSGDVGSVSVRFRDLSTGQMVERRWPILYESNTPRLEQSQPSMQLAAAAALFAAKLGGGPLADSVDMAQLQKTVAKLPEQFASQPRVQQLRAMIEQAIAIH